MGIEISWKEPSDYLAQRRRCEPKPTFKEYLKVGFRPFLFYLILLLILAAIEGHSDFLLSNLLIAILCAFILAYPLVWLLKILPVSLLGDRICINKNGITRGSNQYSFSDIDAVIVGSTNIGGKEFPVFAFRTYNQDVHVSGLSKDISTGRLESILDSYGVVVDGYNNV